MNRRGRSLPRCHWVRCHWLRCHWTHSAGLLLLCCGFSSQAWGYCRTTTAESGSVDDDGCLAEGETLYWPQPCIPMGVHEAAAEEAGISYEAAHDALVGAFSKWSAVECDGEPVALGLVDRGVMHCGVVEYEHEARHSNNNVLMFRDQWPYAEAATALTTLTFAVADGRILDADVEVNTSVLQGSNGNAAELDLDAVLLHEVGHVLGLAHSQVSGAVMSLNLDNGATPPLSDDDCAAICDAFGTGAPRCKTEQEGVDFTRECAEPSELSSDSGCGGSPVAADGTGPRGATVPLLGALALWWARRRRRGQRSHKDERAVR